MQAAERKSMHAETAVSNPFQSVADGLMRMKTITRGELVKNDPWRGILHSLTAEEWEECLASIAMKAKGFYACGNTDWEHDTLDILSAFPSAKNADKVLEWYLESLLQSRYTQPPLSVRIGQLFAKLSHVNSSIAELNWPAINRHMKVYPGFYWMHPRIRQIFADRLIKASTKSKHCPGQEILQGDADNIEQALRRICAAGDVSMLPHIEALYQALEKGEVDVYLNEPDRFLKPTLLAQLDTARKELYAKPQLGVMDLSGFLQRQGWNAQVVFAAETGDGHSLRVRFAVESVDPTLPIPRSLISLRIAFEGFASIALAGDDHSQFLNGLAFNWGPLDQVATLIAVPRILRTEDRVFYGGRIHLTVSCKSDVIVVHHYHFADERQEVTQSPPKIEVTKIRLSLPPKQAQRPVR